MRFKAGFGSRCRPRASLPPDLANVSHGLSNANRAQRAHAANRANHPRTRLGMLFVFCLAGQPHLLCNFGFAFHGGFCVVFNIAGMDLCPPPPQSCPNCFPIFCRRHLPATPLVECRRFHQTSCDFSMLVVHRGRRSSACYTPICSHLGPLALAARSARWVDCDPISCLRQLRHQPRHHATASRCLRASRDCNHCGVGDGLRCVRAIHPGVAALRCGRA